MSSKDILAVNKVASVQNNDTGKGYESVPTKTPNRSEYAATIAQKMNNSQSVNKQKKSRVIQAPVSGKPDGSTDEAATEQSYTESPSKHRKIIRGFPQS